MRHLVCALPGPLCQMGVCDKVGREAAVPTSVLLGQVSPAGTALEPLLVLAAS